MKSSAYLQAHLIKGYLLANKDTPQAILNAIDRVIESTDPAAGTAIACPTILSATVYPESVEKKDAYGDDMSDIPAAPRPKKPRAPRKPLSEEHKQALRDRLALARAAKAAKQEPTTVTPPPSERPIPAGNH